MKTFNMSIEKATEVRQTIQKIKKSRKNDKTSRECAIIAFARVFGTFLPDYTRIVVER